MIYELLKVQVLMLGPSVLFGLILLGFAFRPKKQENAVRDGSWSISWYFAIGYALAYWRIEGTPPFAPKESWQWLCALSLFSGMCGFGLLVQKKQFWTSTGMAGVLAILSGYLLVPEFQTPIYGWRFGIGALIFILWIALQKLSERRSGAMIPLLWSFTYLGASIILMQAGIAKFAQFSGLIALLAGFTFLVVLRLDSLSFASGASYPLSVLLVGLLANGYFNHFSTTPTLCFFGIIFAPLFAWIGQISFLAGLSKWKRLVMEMIFPLLVLSLFCWIALQQPATESLY
ncbi:MAG: hypothetical protein AABZ60_13530 [Planctomycetota bacterium]